MNTYSYMYSMIGEYKGRECVSWLSASSPADNYEYEYEYGLYSYESHEYMYECTRSYPSSLFYSHSHSNIISTSASPLATTDMTQALSKHSQRSRYRTPRARYLNAECLRERPRPPGPPGIRVRVASLVSHHSSSVLISPHQSSTLLITPHQSSELTREFARARREQGRGGSSSDGMGRIRLQMGVASGCTRER